MYLTSSNSKTIKGEKKGYKTFILYLAPEKRNEMGKNLCAKSSEMCRLGCLFSSGLGGFGNVAKARIQKTNEFISDIPKFIEILSAEITVLKFKHKNLAIRLNGTSDFLFENIKINGKNIFEIHSDVQFYDYTKYEKRVLNNKIKNYHLTFSRSENNQKETIKVLESGHNVAVIFDKLPQTYLGYKVINGDESDLRFLDEKNVVVGLKYKNTTNKGASNINKIVKESNFVVKSKDL